MIASSPSSRRSISMAWPMVGAMRVLSRMLPPADEKRSGRQTLAEILLRASIFSGAGVSPACRRIAGMAYRPKDDCRLCRQGGRDARPTEQLRDLFGLPGETELHSALPGRLVDPGDAPVMAVPGGRIVEMIEPGQRDIVDGEAQGR